MYIDKYIGMLTLIGLFDGFSSGELADIFDKSSYKIENYQKDTVIYFQNQRCTTFDIILQGKILIQKIDTRGDVLTVSSFGGGDYLGANLLFAQNNTYPMTVVSKSASTLLHIERPLILDLCQNHKDFLIKYLQSISNRTLILTDKINTLTMKTLRQRITEFLAYEYYRQKNPRIKLSMTKKELSEKLGVQRPSLSRELSKMRKDGILEFDAKYITIMDLDSILRDL